MQNQLEVKLGEDTAQVPKFRYLESMMGNQRECHTQMQLGHATWTTETTKTSRLWMALYGKSLSKFPF